MTNNINNYSKLNIDNIKYSNFTQSLLEEALRVELIDKNGIEKIQIQIMETLSECMEFYTKGESSSLKSETVNELLSAILFNIDVYFISLNNIPYSFELLCNMQSKELYYKGTTQLKAYLVEAVGLYAKVKRSSIETKNKAYNQVIFYSIPDFLKSYDIKFDSHTSITKLNYQLSNSNNTKGIIDVISYLKNLYYENSYCRLFNQDDILKIYNTYCDSNDLTYEDIFLNIYELVFINSLFCELANKASRSLILNKKDCIYLQKKFENLSDLKIEQEILLAVDRLYDEKAYLLKTTNKLMSNILNAIKNNALDTFLVITPENYIYVD